LDTEAVKDPNIRNFVKKMPADMGFEGGGERYFTHLQNGEINVKRLVFFHKGEGRGGVKFGAARESDGTKRIMELLPAFLTCREYSKAKGVTGVVHFVDELDRSVHYLVLHKLLEDMLSTCNADSRSQLIFTTHDLLLMDQELFRRDEILFVERDDFGVSSVMPLNEYRGVRLDKDIRKSYLQGRFGGIPKI
jgi:AAA15 family ATPase/GTPase